MRLLMHRSCMTTLQVEHRVVPPMAGRALPRPPWQACSSIAHALRRGLHSVWSGVYHGVVNHAQHILPTVQLQCRAAAPSFSARPTGRMRSCAMRTMAVRRPNHLGGREKRPSFLFQQDGHRRTTCKAIRHAQQPFDCHIKTRRGDGGSSLQAQLCMMARGNSNRLTAAIELGNKCP